MPGTDERHMVSRYGGQRRCLRSVNATRDRAGEGNAGDADVAAAATDGAEHFAETLAAVTDPVPVRGTSVARDGRRSKYRRSAPRMVTGR